MICWLNVMEKHHKLQAECHGKNIMSCWLNVLAKHHELLAECQAETA